MYINTAMYSNNEARTRAEWNRTWIKPCYAKCSNIWPTWLYKLIKIEWLSLDDARALWMSNVHTRDYPDVRPLTYDKSYIMWSLRQVQSSLSPIPLYELMLFEQRECDMRQYHENSKCLSAEKTESSILHWAIEDIYENKEDRFRNPGSIAMLQDRFIHKASSLIELPPPRRYLRIEDIYENKEDRFHNPGSLAMLQDRIIHKSSFIEPPQFRHLRIRARIPTPNVRVIYPPSRQHMRVPKYNNPRRRPVGNGHRKNYR